MTKTTRTSSTGALPFHRKRWATLLAIVLVLPGLPSSVAGAAFDSTSYVTTEPAAGHFVLSEGGQPAPIYLDHESLPGVLRAAQDLSRDLERVVGTAPELTVGDFPEAKEVVLIGTLGHGPVIDRLVAEGKVDVSDVEGRWEAFVLQVVDDPLPGVDRALVIAGSDRRGTIFGIYDLVEEIGVSPWTWWADVPVPKRPNLYLRPGRAASGAPAVKYRGIFLNDENPALLGWVNETFGGFNHQFYVKVFELILRLKGNYLWPAMWGKAFADDDPLNPRLADEYGIVIGTSHHEPMMRAHVEWERYGTGPWNYVTNADTLRAFWRKGIERMGAHESIVTIGMRGDGDEPMTDSVAVALLESIVADQRQIIAEVTGKNPSETPQVWALYKEVQDYFDQGMRVPDDVTLLFSDDNWGNIRRLPELGDDRPGGYGVYYHFDYVGGPRSYRWINTNQIERVWEQMHLAYQYDATRIWIVNVGDLKPMEFPTDFFLTYAWNPEDWPAERLPEFTRQWAAQQFGETHAAEIAKILDTYTRFNSRRKPELLDPGTYSLTHYREAIRVVNDYNVLVEKAEEVYRALPTEYRDAYFQLVLFPVQASANINELYLTVARNRLYAEQGRAATNEMAQKARELFARDAELTRQFHEDLAGGKWNHMMSQTHIGYTSWDNPPKNVMPEVREIELPEEAAMGVAVEGTDKWWPRDTTSLVLPTFDPYLRQSHYIEVFNRGRTPFEYTAKAEAPWVQIARAKGEVKDQRRLWVSVAWEHAPAGLRRVPITIMGPEGSQVVVLADIFNPESPDPDEVTGFVESNGYVSMEAEHFTRSVDRAPIHWQVIPNLGRTLSAVTALPVTAPAQEPGGDSPHLEYRMHLFSSGPVEVHAYLSPTLDFHATGGLRYAISIDDAPPQIVNIHEGYSERTWEKWVSDNVIVSTTQHSVEQPGTHVLKFWMVDPGVVLQKLVVDTGGLKPSYLGPPESYFRAGE